MLTDSFFYAIVYLVNKMWQGGWMLDSKIIGNNLLNLRKKYKKTTEEVASSCNISRSAISMYENGKRIPRDDIKIKLAKYYNVSIEKIFYPTQPQNEAK